MYERVSEYFEQHSKTSMGVPSDGSAGYQRDHERWTGDLAICLGRRILEA